MGRRREAEGRCSSAVLDVPNAMQVGNQMTESGRQDKWERSVDILRVVLGLVFVVSGISNVYTAYSSPEEYRGFSETALLQVCSDIIDSVSQSLMQILLALVGVYEFLLGLLVLSKGFYVRVGLLMGILFALAISMLGVEELAALALVPIFVYMLTKDFDKSAIGLVRSGRIAVAAT